MYYTDVISVASVRGELFAGQMDARMVREIRCT